MGRRARRASVAVVAVDEAALQSVFAQLRELCADMDSDAADFLGQHDALLYSAFPRQAQAISESINGFDFELAVSQLDAAMSDRHTNAQA